MTLISLPDQLREQARAAQLQAKKLEAAAKAAEKYPLDSEFSDGDIIQFTTKHDLTYVAVRKAGRWWTTAQYGRQFRSLAQLLEFYKPVDMYYVTELEKIL